MVQLNGLHTCITIPFNLQFECNGPCGFLWCAEGTVLAGGWKGGY